MNASEPVGGIVCLILALGAFVISCFQLMEKGFLFNNAYIWATPEERQGMNEHPESKKPYYRQSGIALMLIGIIFLILTAYILSHRVWLLVSCGLVAIMTLVYAIASSVQIERHSR